MLENRMGDSIYLLLLLILQIKDFFLCFNLRAQFFFRGQVQLVFAGKKLLVAVEDGILCNILIRVGAEDDADGWVIALAALQFVIHTNIHIHLTYVLMGNFAGFQIHQHKTFEDIVVEHEVDVVVLFFCMNVLLAGYKGIALAKLHEEFLNVRDDAAFQLAFSKIRAAGKPQKFRNHRVLDELQLVCLITGCQLFHFLLDWLLVLGFQQTVVVLGGNIALQRADAPCLIGRFFRVPVTGGFVLNL